MNEELHNMYNDKYILTKNIYCKIKSRFNQTNFFNCYYFRNIVFIVLDVILIHNLHAKCNFNEMTEVSLF